MSALSDLDELIGQAEARQDYCAETGPNEAMKLATELRSIRATVEQLTLSVGDGSVMRHDGLYFTPEKTKRLLAALARAGGDA